MDHIRRAINFTVNAKGEMLLIGTAAAMGLGLVAGLVLGAPLAFAVTAGVAYAPFPYIYRETTKILSRPVEGQSLVTRLMRKYIGLTTADRTHRGRWLFGFALGAGVVTAAVLGPVLGWVAGVGALALPTAYRACERSERHLAQERRESRPTPPRQIVRDQNELEAPQRQMEAPSVSAGAGPTAPGPTSPAPTVAQVPAETAPTPIPGWRRISLGGTAISPSTPVRHTSSRPAPATAKASPAKSGTAKAGATTKRRTTGRHL